LEAKYPASLLLENYEIDEDVIYVIDTEQEMASPCTINDCSNILTVRKCVDEYKREGLHSETEVISCVEQGIHSRSFSLFDCKSLSANRGDFNGDCRIDLGSSSDSDDYALFSQLLSSLSQAQRNEYRYCGDMDNDGDVDEEDLSCLQYVIQGTWEGDTSATGKGNGLCHTEMQGAFCLDTSDTPGDFNGDWVFDTEDIIALNNIRTSAFAGVTPTRHILDTADFNQDGQISNSDVNCLEKITSSIIPNSCLQIYDFDCGTTQGDLNHDGTVDRLDILLESWVVEGKIINGCDPCTDFNADKLCTNDDLLCLTAIVEQDEENIEDYCTDCVTQMIALDIYGEEVCHDGYDNDCNGEIDDLCECDANQDCLRRYDVDGVVTTEDYLYCRDLSWAGWQWISNEEIMTNCQNCGDFEKTLSCESRGGPICLDKCDGSVSWAIEDTNREIWPQGVEPIGRGCKGISAFMKPGADTRCCNRDSDDCGDRPSPAPENTCPVLVDSDGTETYYSPIPSPDCDSCCVEGPCSSCHPPPKKSPKKSSAVFIPLTILSNPLLF